MIKDINNLKTNKNFIFLPNKDSFGNDILHISSKSIDELIQVCLNLDNCICFNTYGYYKNKLEDSLINLPNNLFNPDGLYINIVRTHDEILCLNLKRRPDRKENMINEFNKYNIKYNFIEAIDGNKLKPTQELIKMFKSNDFGSRLGVIGCALSHLAIWKRLISDNFKKYYIVTEDDIQFHIKFKDYLKQVQNKLLDLNEWDILFLGYHTYKNNNHLYNPNNIYENLQIEIIDFDYKNYIGGFFGFVISKSGAEKIISYTNTNGITHGIDYIIKFVPNLKLLQLKKFIIYSDWVDSANSNVDTDIQKNFEYLDIYSDENFQYLRGFDSSDNDIGLERNLSIDEMKKKALDNDNCVCFNSLGYFKSKCNELKISPYFINLSDGIYIKKKYLVTNSNNDDKII
jgi:GR25 family glycosyltransferase involved in LPS biosynthesis